MSGRSLLVVALAFALVQLVPHRVEASSTCTGTASSVTVGSQKYWIDDRRSKGDGLWVYRESGLAVGLQRGGTFLGYPDPCGDADSDHAVFYAP